MTDTLTITKTEGTVKVLHLAGQLDGQTQQSLLDLAQAEKAAGTRFLLIDLQGVDFIASAGLGALHNIYKLFTPQDEVDTWEQEKHGEPYKSAYFKLAGASPRYITCLILRVSCRTSRSILTQTQRSSRFSA